MDIFYPEYYNAFRCIASACPDSCCKEWEVDVDPESAAFYRSLPGALGDRLRQVLQDGADGVSMRIEDGRCPMWRQDGLCRIQAELGHDSLCKTCREFPRIHHDYGTFVELGLELSCPEAARLILNCESSALQSTTQPGGDATDYDLVTMEILRTSRAQVLTFLDTASCTLPESLAIILLYSHFVQEQIDGGDSILLAPAQLLTQAKSFPKSNDISALFALLGSLEILTASWKERLSKAPEAIRWTPQLKALARYLIQRYWLQAVSDFDLVCRAKFVVAASIAVGALGGDIVQTAQLFSKEIENNPDNIDAILDGAYTSPALTDANLFGILLS